MELSEEEKKRVASTILSGVITIVNSYYEKQARNKSDEHKKLLVELVTEFSEDVSQRPEQYYDEVMGILKWARENSNETNKRWWE
jgi:hypothetical protein